jgi:hypothetical protein
MFNRASISVTIIDPIFLFLTCLLCPHAFASQDPRLAGANSTGESLVTAETQIFIGELCSTELSGNMPDTPDQVVELSGAMANLAIASQSPEDEPTFYLFSKLPNELRSQIWESVEKEPQWVTVQQTAGAYITQEGGWLVNGTELYTVNYSKGIPVLLHVNQETRALALKSYCLIFGAISNHPKYFDARQDALFIADCHTGWVNDRPTVVEDLQLVRNMAIWSSKFLTNRELEAFLDPFHNLRNLIYQGMSQNTLIRVLQGQILPLQRSIYETRVILRVSECWQSLINIAHTSILLIDIKSAEA